VDTTDLKAVERAFTPATRMLFVETPSNPVMRLTDLRGAADLAHRRGASVAVDNTFASPYMQRPIALGADIVLHSTTKYLNGHSDSVGGTKTLKLRMEQHNVNGLAIAQFLSGQSKVRQVHYPGLTSHPQHDLAKRQMNGFGGMIAFDLGSLEAARRLLNSVRLFALLAASNR
jgi:cystathionine beta-lyase/cystathionine gamma-synthase